MPKAYWDQSAPIKKLIVNGQVYELKPERRYPHPLDAFKVWMDRQVDRVLPKIRPRKALGPIYEPGHVSK